MYDNKIITEWRFEKRDGIATKYLLLIPLRIYCIGLVDPSIYEINNSKRLARNYRLGCLRNSLRDYAVYCVLFACSGFGFSGR